MLTTRLLLKNTVYLQNHVSCSFTVDTSCIWPQMRPWLVILDDRLLNRHEIFSCPVGLSISWTHFDQFLPIWASDFF